ncbi:MAG: hypothetical protein AAAB35_27665 [Phyllobacterium sp.]
MNLLMASSREHLALSRLIDNRLAAGASMMQMNAVLAHLSIRSLARVCA